MKTTLHGGRLASGLMALTLAAAFASPARAERRFSSERRPAAERALAKVQLAHAALKDEQSKSGEASSPRQERLLAKAEMELSRASRYCESGRYESALRLADHAAWLLARARLVRNELRSEP